MTCLMQGIGLWLKCKRAAGINCQEEQDNDNASCLWSTAIISKLEEHSYDTVRKELA